MKSIFTFIFSSILASFCLGQSPTKFILLEEFSTAPCGFCPDGDVIANQIVTNHPNVIWVTHHAGFGTDSMTIPESGTIANAFTTFAPGGVIDRGYYNIPVYTIPPYIAVSRQKWDSVCTAHLNDTPFVDINITNQYDSTTRLLNCIVDANFQTIPASGDLRLNVFLSEDSVVGFGHGYDQKSYFNTTVGHPYYGMGDTIVGYVHHHVMRKVLTGSWGLTGVIPNTPATGTIYSHTFSNIPVSTRWKDKDIDVIAFISYYNSNAQQRKVLNSNHLKLKSLTTGIKNELAEKAEVAIFPVPANNHVNISILNNSTHPSIKICNLLGECVFELKIADQENYIDISSFSKGLYLIEVKSGNEIIKSKFLKN